MKTDIEIAREAALLPVDEIARKLGLPPESVSPYGHFKAKIDQRLADTLYPQKPDGKVILVTAITPTPAGEGKTTTTVGLGDALSKLGKRVVICLREPSLGPVFGMKGGAAGGGYAQVAPMEDINLHFTGDLHAITTANNLLAALLDNHIYQGNRLGIDPRRVVWRRAMDMNDRQLRGFVGGLGGKTNGTPREDGFDITAASEVMAVFCLSKNLADLKENLSRIVVAYTYDGAPVTAGDLQAQGAMTALLTTAFNPNLVQTLENTPAFIHGGPFANIAHGCNTIAATKLSMRVSDYVVTEAGFGADLGAEKFIDIKCRRMHLTPSAVVLVATVRALKHHGGNSRDALNNGMPNLLRHIENITQQYRLPCVMAVNRFPTDTEEELATVLTAARTAGVEADISDVYARGGEGAVTLAGKVLEAVHAQNKQDVQNKSATTQSPDHFRYVYDTARPLTDKIETIARTIYRAAGVHYTPEATKQLREMEKSGHGTLPVCIAKTQYSFTDNAKKVGAPTGFTITIRQARLSAGAGFVVAIAGDIMTMPGLPKIPAAEAIDVDGDGIISGLF